jgi:hypothetical protein
MPVDADFAQKRCVLTHSPDRRFLPSPDDPVLHAQPPAERNEYQAKI